MKDQNKENSNIQTITDLQNVGDDTEMSLELREKLLTITPDNDKKVYTENFRKNKPVVAKHLDTILDEGVNKNLIDQDVVDKAKELEEIEMVKDLLNNYVPNAFVAKALLTLFAACMALFALVATLTIIEFSWITMHFVGFVPFIIAVFYVESWKDPVYNWYTRTFNKKIVGIYTRSQVVDMVTANYTKRQLQSDGTLPHDANVEEIASEETAV